MNPTPKIKPPNTRLFRLAIFSATLLILGSNTARGAVTIVVPTSNPPGSGSNQRVTLELERSAFPDIEASLGGFFSVGGALLSIDHRGEGVTELLFGGIPYSNEERLHLTVGGSDVTVLTSLNPFAGSANSGWFSETDSTSADNTSHIAGLYNSNDYRNFFSFDLSGLGGIVTRAALDLSWRVDTPDINPERFGVFSVETDAATLNLTTGIDAGIYDDLGSGPSYGEFLIIPEHNSIILLGVGIAGIAMRRRSRH